MDREITQIFKKLNLIPTRYFNRRERKKLLTKAAKPAIRAIKAKVPVNDGPHLRYQKGEIVAAYYPGNLKRAIRALLFKKSPDVFIGPKAFSGANPYGQFRGNRVDGYYGHFVEYGTVKQAPQPYMRPGWASSKAGVNALITELSRKVFNAFKSRHTR